MLKEPAESARFRAGWSLPKGFFGVSTVSLDSFGSMHHAQNQATNLLLLPAKTVCKSKNERGVGLERCMLHQCISYQSPCHTLVRLADEEAI